MHHPWRRPRSPTFYVPLSIPPDAAPSSGAGVTNEVGPSERSREMFEEYII